MEEVSSDRGRVLYCNFIDVQHDNFWNFIVVLLIDGWKVLDIWGEYRLSFKWNFHRKSIVLYACTL